MVTTRLRDTTFKRVLRRMHLDSEGKIEGPPGNLTLHNNAIRPAAPLAGGLGRTFLRSVVMGAAKEKLPRRISLFYRPEDAVFRDEWGGAEQQNQNYKLFTTMTLDGEIPSPPERGKHA